MFSQPPHANTRPEELPVRLAHRVKELDQLPHNLSAMPSITRVKEWYAQSFEVRLFRLTNAPTYPASQELISFPTPKLPRHIRDALAAQSSDIVLPESTPNPSLPFFVDDYGVPTSTGLGFAASKTGSPNGQKHKLRIPMERRYYANTIKVDWPPELQDFNRNFTKALDHIKRRHDPTVTTVAQGVLEWKRSQNARNINLDVQHWLDRFYLSRIGIRFLIGQREHCPHPSYPQLISPQTSPSTPCSRTPTTSASSAPAPCVFTVPLRISR